MIEGHALSYIGRKVGASDFLHPGALSAKALCGIPSYMERKATYIRAWRNKRGHSLDDMVGRMAAIGVETTGASLSRIERGLQPYNQDMLEAIAAALDVEAWQLIRDNPDIPEAQIIDLLQRLNKDEAEQADKVLRAMFGDRGS